MANVFFLFLAFFIFFIFRFFRALNLDSGRNMVVSDSNFTEVIVDSSKLRKSIQLNYMQTTGHQSNRIIILKEIKLWYRRLL